MNEFWKERINDACRGKIPDSLTKNKVIFVFGSNLAGRHGRGAAAHAKQYYGAKYGIGEGLQGSSYGLPTKDEKIKTLLLRKIEKYVNTFLKFAKDNPQFTFYVTKVGCGLAGYKNYQIAPMFKNYTNNIVLDNKWLEIIMKGK